MAWFGDWWSGLSFAEQALYCVALPSTLLLIVQTILMVIGASDGDAGGDISDLGGGIPSDFGLGSLFTLQGIVSFLCVFGWTGALMIGGGVPVFLSLPAAFLLGFAVMYGVAKFIRFTSKMAHSGNLDVKNLLGELGTVYLVIPPKGEGYGKVMIQTSERYVEFDAVSEEERQIPGDTPIRVVDILGGNVLVVERQK